MQVFTVSRNSDAVRRMLAVLLLALALQMMTTKTRPPISIAGCMTDDEYLNSCRKVSDS